MLIKNQCIDSDSDFCMNSIQYYAGEKWRSAIIKTLNRAKASLHMGWPGVYCAADNGMYGARWWLR
jgi:hypothetical protein